MAIIDNIKKFNTGLTKEQIAEAFERALNDYTDTEIDNKLKKITDVIFDSGTLIENGTDLDNIDETGAYYADVSTTSTLENCPTEKSFRLDVIKLGLGSYSQRISEIDATDVVFYVRNYSQGRYTAWHTVTAQEVT